MTQELARALGAATVAELSAFAGVADGLTRLRAVHVELWQLEDRARSTRASDTLIAETKRRIDRYNALRHETLDATDALCLWPSPRAGARAVSETPCELADRLLILDLKVLSLERLTQDPQLPAQQRRHCAERLSALRKWQAHLQACLWELLSELGVGHVRLPPRHEVKLYNDKTLNPVTRDE